MCWALPLREERGDFFGNLWRSCTLATGEKRYHHKGREGSFFPAPAAQHHVQM